MKCKVVQRYPPMRVSLRAEAEAEGLSIQGNGLLKVPLSLQAGCNGRQDE